MSESTTLTDEMVTFLEELRDSGSINMMGAAPELEREFGMSRRNAQEALKEWMFG